MVTWSWAKDCWLCYYKSLLSLAELKQWFGGTRLEMPSPVHRRSQDFWLGGGGANQKSHAMKSSEIFERGIFVGQRYRRMEDQKPWPGLALIREFSKGRGLKPKVTNENIVYSNVSQTGIWGRSPKSLGDFLEFFGKKAINAFGSHFARVQNHLKEVDYQHLKANWKKLKCFNFFTYNLVENTLVILLFGVKLL